MANVITTYRLRMRMDDNHTFDVTINSARKQFGSEASTVLVSGMGLCIFINAHEAVYTLCRARRNGTVKRLQRKVMEQE